jgi:uncharacterized membrane protein (DUF373 family)
MKVQTHEQSSEPSANAAGWRVPVAFLVGAERAIFALVGALFFIAAFALALRSTVNLWALIGGPRDEMISAATTFLNLMLLVLMMVELAYTVIVSLQGKVLSAGPFLIVGLIAVIRRILVITIGDVNPSAATPTAGKTTALLGSQPLELVILTVVVLVLVGSIVILRERPLLNGLAGGES